MTPLPYAASPNRRFATTRWSLVVQAKEKGAPQAAQAMAELCRAYWYPLYAFVRRISHDTDEAQDLTQSFFTRLLEKDFLGQVAPGRGRFRGFLLAAIKHFVANEWDRERAIKRGGDLQQVSIDAARFDWSTGESRFLSEPAHELTPERLFERQWALALLDRVLNRLRDEHIADSKLAQFEALQPFLSLDRDTANYGAAALTLNTTEAAARVAAHRLRKRYRALLRQEIEHTVAAPQDVDDEIRHLFDVLSK